VLAVLPAPALRAATNEQPNAALPGLGDPGKLTSLAIDAGNGLLRGPDTRLQLIVTGTYSSGQLRDLTPNIQYEVSPAGIVRIDDSGYVFPQGDGKATIKVKGPENSSAEAVVTVEKFNETQAINFPNQIVPIFTKLGCNAGGCHGKASGQNGFKLSLLGFYPNEDHEHLVKEDRGRRLFPASPERSLLLLKATNVMAHGGGARMQLGSYEYQLLARWIGQGMPYGKPTDPTVAKIEVVPPARTMGQGGSQQLSVRAIYTDGTIEDVTRMAQFEANNPEMAETSVTGLTETLDLTGDVAVMVRFQGQVAVFQASIPLGIKVDKLPEARNYIDDLVFEKLKTLGIPPSANSDDASFLRRTTLDVVGRLPTADEAREFAADQDPGKRDKLIDRLLASSDYADYFAGKWSNVLRNKRVNAGYLRGSFLFHDWIRQSLHENKPYDQFVREILTASGDLSQNPPVVWYRAVATNNEQLEDSAQLFLGLRIQCARCHHHPFEKWSQTDYYGFSAFFSRVGRKPGQEIKEEARIFHNRGMASATNPRSGESLKPTGLGGQALDLKPDDDPRVALADWMADPNNPFFAKALVNRYWKHFFSRGLVDPEDDMRVTNPPCNPKLLDALAQKFIDSNYDLKGLVRTIVQSKTYQLSAEPNEYNARDKQNFSRYYPKRLGAEVLYDALSQVTTTNSTFNGLPVGTRAVQLPDNGFDNYFLSVFGKPQNESACECERSSDANLAQALHLLNSREVQSRLTDGNGAAATLAKDKNRGDEDKIRDLYLSVYSRQPTADELKFSLAHLEKPAFKDNKQPAYEDILWALINTKEFLFNH